MRPCKRASQWQNRPGQGGGVCIRSYFKQLVRSALQYGAELFYILITNGPGLVIDQAVKILIAQIHLDIQPVFRVVLLGKNVQDSQLNHNIITLLFAIMISKIYSLHNLCIKHIMYTLDTIFWGLLRGEQMNKDVENYVKKNEEIELITGLLQEPDLLFLIMDREQKDFVYLSRGIRRQLGITKDGRMADPAQETGDSLIRWLYCRLISWMKGEKSAFCVYNSLKMKNIWLRVQASFPEKGNPARQVFLFSDITGEQEEIEALRGKLEEAERRSREKTRLVSDMSHEFRTPINAIMGMTRLAQASKGEEEKRSRCLEKVENACAYLQELVNDVLDMSRIERGKYTVDQESFSLSHLLAGLKELIETQCGEKQLKLTFIMEQVVHGSLTGDELGLRRVFLNLLSNAVKYTPEGGQITFGVKEEAYNDGTAHFLFWVRDSGIGISPGFMAHLFEPFQRERKDGNVEGTGLGLIISKSIVEVMGGRIWAESEEGKGSCFFVELSLGTAGT